MRIHLTYFTPNTKAELEDIVKELSTILPKSEIVNLFLERFDANKIYTVYNIDISSKLESAIKKTLEYDIDTEYLLHFICDIIDGSNES